MAAVVVQMTTPDRVGSETVPVDVAAPLTAKAIIAAAAKKFKSVSKQGRVYHGTTGAELTGDVQQEDLSGSFVVLGGKAGWRGAERLASAYEAARLRAAEAAPAGADEAAAGAARRSTYAALLEAAREERGEGVVLCWKETQDNGYLSNWAPSAFAIDGISYNCAEQWIMACKARTCGDEKVLGQIMQSKSPRKQKALGRSLNLAQRGWTLQARWQVQVQGARAKFQQNEALAVRLLRTGRKMIAEASPADCIFGIGLAPNDPLAQNPANWRGQNLLGKALMRVRDELRGLVLSQAPGFEGDLQKMLEAAGPRALGEEGEEEVDIRAAGQETDLSEEDEPVADSDATCDGS